MNKLLNLVLFLSLSVFADNEIYVDQSGNSASIDLEQLGSSNLITGTSGVSGTLTALDLDGDSLTLDINQIGDSNKFLGDILADSLTGFFEFDGDSNTFTIQVDPVGAVNIDVKLVVLRSALTFLYKFAINIVAKRPWFLLPYFH